MSESILERIARSDADAVKECLDRFGGLVWSLARRFTRDPVEAEDAVQEIFIAVWESARRYDPAKASESTFIAMIARRRLIDRLRSQKRTSHLDFTSEVDPEARASGEASAETRLDVSRVADALDKLKPEQKQMLELSIAEGLSHQQISATTGVALGTVKSHVRRGLIRVRELLAESEGVGPAADPQGGQP
ncbi:MAG: RNA polymerase sigma factor [Myxococcota bacterium]